MRCDKCEVSHTKLYNQQSHEEDTKHGPNHISDHNGQDFISYRGDLYQSGSNLNYFISFARPEVICVFDSGECLNCSTRHTQTILCAAECLEVAKKKKNTTLHPLQLWPDNSVWYYNYIQKSYATNSILIRVASRAGQHDSKHHIVF